MSGIEWREPPAIRRGKSHDSKWKTVESELAKRPGAWARVYAHAQAGTAASKANYLKRVHGLEAISRGEEDGTYSVYARYVLASRIAAALDPENEAT